MGEDIITSAFIIEALRGGLSADRLVSMIRNQSGGRPATRNDLLALKAACVPNKVIAAFVLHR